LWNGGLLGKIGGEGAPVIEISESGTRADTQGHKKFLKRAPIQIQTLKINLILNTPRLK